MSKQLKLGLFGFGCVGQGLYDVFNGTQGFKAEIVKIVVKDRTKKRSLAAEYFSFDKNDILQNPDINVVVEMIDTADEAYEIVTTALKNGKHVVTANKKMVAEHHQELVELQQKHGVSLLYEASSCGSIPIIRNLEEYYDNDLLNSVSGIFNGSSNYVLSKVFNEGLAYDTAVKQALDLGFLETNPILDLGGFDAKYKLCIITAHAYGLFVKPEEVFNLGIQNFSTEDVSYAREKGYKIKLVPIVKKLDDATITLFVLPQFVGKSHKLYNVENEFNAVVAEAAFAEQQLFYGKGAGGHPTGSAVLSDISALRYGYSYEYKKVLQNENKLKYTTNVDLNIYLRYKDADLPGKLGFKEINEQFSSKNFKYVVGTISLQKLIDNRELIDNPNVAVISLGDVAKSLVNENVEEAILEESHK